MGRTKTGLDSFLAHLRQRGWDPTLTDDFLPPSSTAACGRRTSPLAFVATWGWPSKRTRSHSVRSDVPGRQRGMAAEHGSPTLHPPRPRHDHAPGDGGWFPSGGSSITSAGPEKPSSWPGLIDFAETIKNALPQGTSGPCSPEVRPRSSSRRTPSPMCSPRPRESTTWPCRRSAATSPCPLPTRLQRRGTGVAKLISAFYLGDFDASGFRPGA